MESLAGGSDRIKIFKEKISSVARERPQLEALIDYVRDGDEIVVTRLDRLARSVADMVDIVRRVRTKGATIRLPGIGVINGDDPTSELLLNVLAAIAQFERQIMLARQREGIAKARRDGKYKGRAPTARRQAEQIRRLADDGMRKEDIADDLGISRASVYRILSEETGQAALKEKAIIEVLKAHPELTDRAVAKRVVMQIETETGLHDVRPQHTTVARVRRELTEDGIMPWIDPANRHEEDGRRARGRKAQG